MKVSQNFLWIGILCILGGFILVAAGNSVWENTTFFVFPFFVFSGSDPISIFIALGFMLFIVLLMWRTTSGVAIPPGIGGRLQVEGKCSFCSSPLPKSASFCSNCGNPIEDNLMGND